MARQRGKVEAAISDHLLAAVATAGQVINNSAMRRLHARYFSATMSVQTFQRILAEPQRILTAHQATQDAFVEFARSRAEHLDFQALLYRGGLEALGGTSQEPMAHYVGAYTSFRTNVRGTDLVLGTIKIWKSDSGNYYFEHFARQIIEEYGDQVFSHTGPAFILSDRIYLLGIGQGEGGSYLRPMILKSVDNPKANPIIGVLMTETTSRVPFSTKAVLLSEDRVEHLRNSMGEAFERYVRQCLRNESDSSQVVLGWDWVRNAV